MKEADNLVAGDGWISDESSFCGDEIVQETLEQQCEDHAGDTQTILAAIRLASVAYNNRKAAERKAKEQPALHNPPQGQAKNAK
ncbi:MAG: hypothetical protein M1822_004256 [Bathelium mastoideum]|nr:MAG: hypothetical protein M1822_004256 [Bathelium mastoideum]